MTAIREVPPARWDEVLRTHGLNDIYASHGYVSATCLLEPGEPRLLELRDAEGSVFFPLIVRDIHGAERLRDVTTPYGYGGAFSSDSSPPWPRFSDAYQEWCRRENVVSTFVRFHPRFSNEVGATSMQLSALAGVIGWRVGSGRDLLAGMHPHHRRLVRKATSAGIRPAVTEAPTSLEGFRSIYETTMRRLDATSFYFFNDDYWESLIRDLRDRLLLVESTLDEQVVAAVLCLDSAPWLHYHLGASDEVGRASGASHLALFAAAEWAQAKGYSRFNLGGGVGGHDDSLLSFKRRFDSDGLLPSYVGRQINDPIAYHELSGVDPDGMFFPAYRASEHAMAPDQVRAGGA